MVKAAVLGAAGQIGSPLSLLLKMVRTTKAHAEQLAAPKAKTKKLTRNRALWSQSWHYMMSSTHPA